MTTWKTLGAWTIAALLLAPLAVALADEPPACIDAEDDFTWSFRIQDCHFETTGGNPYFILRPGRKLVLTGEDDGEPVRLEITALRQTRAITFKVGSKSRTVMTRVVEERESKGGELVEVSRNFFAVCAETNDVYYFGEEVDIYEDGEIVSHEGAWLAGRNGARPGIIMPGTFLLGSRYYQELACGVALDRAEHVRMGFSVRTSFGRIRDCVEITETTPLEPDSESTKVYAAGIGLVMDGDLELAAVIGGDDDDD